MQSHRYGSFGKGGRSFQIVDPATPMPWVNVICNGRYGLVVSQRGGGFSWFDDAQHNVITRWEMDLVRDSAGKHLLLHDRDMGVTWSAAPAPTNVPMDRYECEHEQGRTTFRTAAHGIACEWGMCVAPRDAVELWLVTLTNESGRPRRLRVASSFEWCCGVAPDSKREFHRLFFMTKHDAGRRAILATKNMWDIPTKNEKEHWNVAWPYVAAHAVCGVTFERDLAIGDKRTFLGGYGTHADPAGMRGEISKDGRFGRFGDAYAALGGDLTLRPGEKVTLHYVLAIASKEPEVLALLDRYAKPEAARAAYEQSELAWRTRLAPVQVSTARTDFDDLNTHWLAYQAISGRMWGRTGYYQQSGARGFRDQLQDSQVWLAYDPAQCLEQLALHATRQFQDGSVNHWWHALADFGNRTACSDDYLWLAFVAAAYVRETGDVDALTRVRAPFRDDPGQEPATLAEHCRRSIARAFQRMSPRGLPLIGSCDWNDGLSAMGIEGKGESVWLGMFLCQVLADWSVLSEQLGDATMAKEYSTRREALLAAVNAHGWDGEWYRYGTKDSGAWVGSASSPEGKIHLNPQTWSVLADVASPERARSAWSAVKQQLLSAYGPLLLAPAYTVPDETLGYITRYSPGSRENGGVYMHAATWALAAAAKVGDAESVEKIWDAISPALRGKDADRYWAEPYVTPGNVDGPLSDLPGRAGWTWYTGSAAWLQRVCLEWVLGVRPVWEGLQIAPVPAGSLGAVKVTRRWRGVDVRVSFHAGEYVAGRRALVSVDGRVLTSGVIPVSMATSAGAKGLDVEVTWTATATVEAPAAATTPARRLT
jgi:cellobiose phosphorylase